MASPLGLRFSLDAGLLASAGLNVSNVAVFRDGVPIGACTNPAVATAAPDPCVFLRQTLGDGSGEIDVYTSHASHWNFGQQLVTPAPLAISTTSLPNGGVGASYSKTLTSTGGAPPVSWSISSGALPAGLTLDPSTGVISGTPTASTGATPAQLTVRAVDTNLPTASVGDEAIVDRDCADGQPGQGNHRRCHTGVAVSRVQRRGAVPLVGRLRRTSGRAHAQRVTGAISGTPNTEGRFSFAVQVVDSKPRRPNKVTTNLSITVAPIAITIAPSTLGAATKGVKYSAALSAAGARRRITSW